jgi:hypothetical protein
LTYGIKEKIKYVDVLDCIAMYCKIDPLKKGYILTNDAVQFIENKIQHVKSFNNTNIKLKRWTRISELIY